MNDNLIPFDVRGENEARELGQKGGIKSGEVRRKKKLIKEQLELLLSLPLKDKNATEKLKSMGIDADNVDNQMAMIISMWNKAIKGDVQAFNSIRDSVGEKPKEVIDNNLRLDKSPINELLSSIEELKNEDK